MSRSIRVSMVFGVVALVLSLPRVSLAQGVEVPEIVTDRPDFTESSESIRKGGFQFESGVSFEGDGRDVRSFTAPSALMRIGIGRGTELRFAGDGLLSEAISGVRSSGYSDIEVGAKFHVVYADRAGFDLAILPFVSLPIGADGFSSGTVDPTLKITWARELPAGFGVTGNVNVSVLSDDAGRFDQKSISFSFGHDLIAGWGSYGEIYGFSRLDRDGSRAITVNGGISHPAGDRMQFDFEAGRGITADAPDWFFGAGFAIRGSLRRK